MTPLWCLQKSVLQEAAALRASQELIAEEEQKQALAAAKKARKERAKAKKQQSHECPLRKPDVTVESPDAVAPMGTFLKGTELSTSSASAGKENACDVASMNTLLDVRPSSGESAIAFMRSSDQKERPGSGIEGSVLSALPTRVAGSALTTDSSISSFGSSTLEERMLHLMLCPITQVQSRCFHRNRLCCSWWRSTVSANSSLSLHCCMTAEHGHGHCIFFAGICQCWSVLSQSEISHILTVCTLSFCTGSNG